MGTHREYRLEGPYFALSLPLLFFCILCGVIFKRVLKSILSIISAAGFRKKNKHGIQLVSIKRLVRVKIIISLLRAVVQN